MTCGAHTEEPAEIPAGKWNWLCIPLASLGWCTQVLDACSTLTSNIAFAVGMHIKHRYNADESDVLPTSVVTED